MQHPKDFPGLYATALKNADRRLMKSLYHPDIVMFDVWNDYALEGKAEVEAMIDNWFDSVGSENVTVDFEETESSFGESVGFTYGFVEFSAHSDEGIEIRHIKERMTLCLIRENGEWLVVNQHTSVPITIETGGAPSGKSSG